MVYKLYVFFEKNVTVYKIYFEKLYVFWGILNKKKIYIANDIILIKMPEEEVKEVNAASPEQQCIFCKIIKGEITSKKIYEDNIVSVILDINPANLGHALILPKEHYAIMPQVPQEELGHMFKISKHISNCMLKALDVKGTTIFVANGAVAGQKAPHFMIHVIPRKEGDGLFEIPKRAVKEGDLEKVQQIILAKLKEKLGREPMQEKTGERDDMVEEKEEKVEEKQATEEKEQKEVEEENLEETNEKVEEKEKKINRSFIKMTCEICQIFENKDVFKVLYEDELCLAILHEKPANYGHVMVIPKEHYVIMEDVPDKIIEHLFLISNIISTAIFESLNVQGTNILVNNGQAAKQENPHFLIYIIPRTENDGINFEWKAEPAKEDDLTTTELKLKELTEKIVMQEEEKEPEKIEQNIETVEDEDLRFKQLHRIP